MKLTEPGPQLSVQDIELFEGELGFDLPLDYRAFLITHNGGSPEESSFVYIPPFQKTLVHVFFGLGVGAEPAMAKWLSELRDEIPKSLLPIGMDAGGNFFVLGLSGNESGVVYYWDKNRLLPDSDDCQNTFPIAANFTEFVDKIRCSMEENMSEFSMEHSIGEVAPPIDELMSFSAKTPLGKRLDKIAETYPRFRHTGRIIDYCSSALFGFSLTLASAEWEPSDTKFLNSRLEKVDENLALATFVRSCDAARNFYGFMWGFVLGQYSAELLTDKEFMSSKSVVGEAVLRNQIHAS